jgi:hypothetical protein
MSLLWGWGIDGHRPDSYDWLAAAIVAIGVAVIFFSPRRAAPRHEHEPCTKTALMPAGPGQGRAGMRPR